MAGDWLKFETSTLDKPEVWAIAQTLGIDPDAVVGKLLRVWSWFDQQSTSGNAPSVTKALLDRASGVTGFCDAVIKAGWMLDDGENISLPNFERHNGKTAKTRAQTGKRVKDHRVTVEQDCNAPSVTKALPEKRREEKRREDLKDVVLAAPSNTSAVATVEKRSTKGTRLPTEWALPKDWGNWALERGMSRDAVLLEAETFRNHWVAKTGKDACKADWEATWRNWIIRATKDRPKTFYELTKEAKERDADKRLKGIANADMETLEALGLARDGRILGT